MMVDILWKLLLHSDVMMDILLLEMTQESVKHQDPGVNSQYVEVTKQNNLAIKVDFD